MEGGFQLALSVVLVVGELRRRLHPFRGYLQVSAFRAYLPQEPKHLVYRKVPNRSKNNAVRSPICIVDNACGTPTSRALGMLWECRSTSSDPLRSLCINFNTLRIQQCRTVKRLYLLQDAPRVHFQSSATKALPHLSFSHVHCQSQGAKPRDPVLFRLADHRSLDILASEIATHFCTTRVRKSTWKGLVS